MTSDKTLEGDEVHTFLEALIGNIVWGVCREDHGVIELEFGDPYLMVVKEPTDSVAGESPAVARIFRQRIVRPTGRWSLFVEVADWSISYDGLTARRHDMPAINDKICMDGLNGQKLVGKSISGTQLTLDFDLGASVTIVRNSEMDDCDQWTLFEQDGRSLCLNEDDEFVIGN